MRKGIIYDRELGITPFKSYAFIKKSGKNTT